MTLTAPAVAKLVELDPDGTVQLAKAAAQQVAQEIAKRMTRDAAETAVQNFLQSEVVIGSYWHQRLNQKYGEMIAAAMKQMAKGFIKSLTDGKINKLLNEAFNRAWSEAKPQIERQMTETADQLLRERFAAMFETKR